MKRTERVEFTGGCHCGAVRFSAQTESCIALACNCSICSMAGYLHVIVPETDFRLLQGDEVISNYRFNTNIAVHSFCNRCGIKSFYRPRSHPDGISINLRCIDSTDVQSAFEIVPFDGRNWEDHVESIRVQETH